jgi:hypothetical protein
MTRKNRIMIFGPKVDGTYVIEFRTAAGEVMAIFPGPKRQWSGTFRSDCPMGSSCRT